MLWENIALLLFLFNTDTGSWLRSPHLHSKLLPNETIYLLDCVSMYEPRLALNSCSFCFSMDYKYVTPCKALCHVLCSIYSSCFCFRNHKLWKKILELLWVPWKYSFTAFKEVKAMTSSLCECQLLFHGLRCIKDGVQWRDVENTTHVRRCPFNVTYSLQWTNFPKQKESALK